MPHVRLIHGNNPAAEAQAALLRAAGYEVAFEPLGKQSMEALKQNPPDAMVIDLSRSPSLGRDIALALRTNPGTRYVPLVLIEGDPEKTAQVKALLPDAVYTSWSRIAEALESAIANPPVHPVVPQSNLVGYSGTPLPKKLGIKEGSVVLMVGAPDDFEATLGDLPGGVSFTSDLSASCDLILWFIRSREELDRRVKEMGARTGKGGLWIIWPKKASGVVTDVSETIVRETGLASGLVDYKICAMDATWSGLRFARRKRL